MIGFVSVAADDHPRRGASLDRAHRAPRARPGRRAAAAAARPAPSTPRRRACTRRSGCRSCCRSRTPRRASRWPCAARPAPQQQRATSANTSIIVTAAIADTGRSAEKSAPTSAVASTENSRNGASTLKLSCASTGRASGPSTPVRAASQPTKTASAMTANPVKMSITRARPGRRGPRASFIARPYSGRAAVRAPPASWPPPCPPPRLEATLGRTEGRSMSGAHVRQDPRQRGAGRGIRAPRARRRVVARRELPERRADLPHAQPAARRGRSNPATSSRACSATGAPRRG